MLPINLRMRPPGEGLALSLRASSLRGSSGSPLPAKQKRCPAVKKTCLGLNQEQLVLPGLVLRDGGRCSGVSSLGPHQTLCPVPQSESPLEAQYTFGMTAENKAVLIFWSDLGFFLKRVNISLQNMPALGEAKRESHSSEAKRESHGSEPPVFTYREIHL